MKVHLIKRQSLEDFASVHVRSRNSIENWLEKIRHADWKNPADIKTTFNSVDFLGNHSNRVIFNIGGNMYRLICKYFFGDKQIHLFVCWIGTHSEYNELNKKNEQYTVNRYSINKRQ